ncbi:e2F associated phosphoprotein [Echinococcus multilocularis]|uniref:E2F associated phosphoprotein n=1 Tax=Echinococcus multilocularis TaxID=6211 RepID=A0A068Y1Q4_ECHMU|nr:e2F associated phosphoprotein [Echinococcus multilocularis]
MFNCSYDGCSDDSSSTEYAPYLLTFRDSCIEIDAERADEFEKKMMYELQSDICSYSKQYLSPEETDTDPANAKASAENDLFYDSDEDKINAEFAKHLQKVSQGGELGDGKTDAVLNCPGCMSLLCLNCQRHSKYKTQYRTMFTFNCKVVEDEVLHPQPNNHDMNAEGSSDEQSVFKQVLCEICDTPVGLLDSSGVYHLFGVLASHS